MNAFVDSLYVSELVVSLVTSTVSGWRNDIEGTMILNLLGKYCPNFLDSKVGSLDTVLPKHYLTCIQQNIRMALVGARKLSFEELLYMTLDKYPWRRGWKRLGYIGVGRIKTKASYSTFLRFVC